MSSPTLPTRTSHLLLAGAILLLDQASKWLVGHSLALGQTRRVIPGLFNLTHLQNRGAAFGLLADFASPLVLVFLIAFSAAVLVLLGNWLWRGPGSRWAGWGLALILGGALGNLFDRLRTGRVVDFLDFHLGAYHWPAFNLADTTIVVGAAVLLAELLRSRHRVPGEV